VGPATLRSYETEFLMSQQADLATAKVRELKATKPFRSPVPVDPYRVYVMLYQNLGAVPATGLKLLCALV
jgi:hypothetical protein